MHCESTAIFFAHTLRAVSGFRYIVFFLVLPLTHSVTTLDWQTVCWLTRVTVVAVTDSSCYCHPVSLLLLLFLLDKIPLQNVQNVLLFTCLFLFLSRRGIAFADFFCSTYNISRSHPCTRIAVVVVCIIISSSVRRQCCWIHHVLFLLSSPCCFLRYSQSLIFRE